jgi:hypothetical protein
MTRFLEILEEELELAWETYLKEHGVKLPAKGKKQRCVLVGLYAHLGRAISQDDLYDWILENYGQKYDRQARHLAAKGWYLVTGKARSSNMEVGAEMNDADLMLVSIEKPNPIFLDKLKIKRKMEMVGGDWKLKLKEFSDAVRGCAVCGRFFDSYDKGHLNPELPYTVENIVPMCVDCNNWAQRRNASFDFNKGTLVARPILPIPEPKFFENN